MKREANKNLPGLPSAQGLYDPDFEKDACGVGLIVDIKGRRSHQIIPDALTILKNLAHRGACGCEENSGDGAGILIQVPDRFFQKVCPALNINLPAEGDYGVGQLYMPQDDNDRKELMSLIEKIIAEEGQTFLGWREVPTDHSSLGQSARSTEPKMLQVFVQRSEDIPAGITFERKLYVIRKRAEIEFNASGKHGSEYFYASSFSSKVLVVKGMLTPEQVELYYPDLDDPDMESALALVHSRFSTNTFPSWERSHPYRYIIHNGEINTLRGNVNWMKARQAKLAAECFGDDMHKILPVIDESGSDSSMFDNCFEFLYLAGRPMHHVAMMMVPEPWEKDNTMPEELRSFYEYHASLMEPWDGPASIAFTDGHNVGSILDRNGLRPSRYYITKDDKVVMASEVGVLDIDPSNVAHKGRLQPGRMFLIDTSEGRIVSDEELKSKIAAEKPYGQWIKDNLLVLDQIPGSDLPREVLSEERRLQLQKAFGYTLEDLRKTIGPMSQIGVEPVASMGSDTPLAVLSNRSNLLYNYFKQLFAQVTNPPIDAIREEVVTSTVTTIGAEQNLLNPTPESCRQIKLPVPIITCEELERIKLLNQPGFKSATLPMLYAVEEEGRGLEYGLQRLFAKADHALNEGATLLILSDKDLDADHAPIPALLAVAGLHHHLIREGRRGEASILLESGEPREVHHFALLLGYGVGAICPYMAFQSLLGMIEDGFLEKKNIEEVERKYIKGAVKGVVKTMSKMGISTIQSYSGAQIFEAIGINKAVVDKYFTWTATRIEGAGLNEIAQEVSMRHLKAFPKSSYEQETLDPGGQYQWRKDGEFHLFNPQTVHLLQHAARKNNYDVYKVFADRINQQGKNLCTLRGLLEFKEDGPGIPLEEVESVEEIMKRFKSGAMSYGSISKEAHETLAIAMNRIGGRSNTGEGGEDPARFIPMENGDSKKSAIKQVASGRFGVTSEYLVNSKEIQIKMAQGAKPGEGGQLPGTKVYPWIAKVRLSTPGVGLISPPPHHDIYSIEDLAELIHDLKNANPDARINVKLVAEVGVGTIAAGVAKGHADVVLISGFDGGTGASPMSSIKHAGLPWELGVAETHQTLVLNNLRSRIVVETDGQLKTGRDVAIAALLGAEEFGFATAPLVAMGCVMMRVCHLNTCPVGVATQDPRLRKKFTGDPAHVVNYLRFIAEEMREIMARLGFKTVNEMIGRTDRIEAHKAIDHWKAKGLDFSPILYSPPAPDSVGRYCQMEQDHGLDESLDRKVLLDLCRPAIEKKEKVVASVEVKNTQRVVGTILGSEISKRYGAEALPEDTIQLNMSGSAGQSFGAFVPKGVSLHLEGDANDYLGKGLSGGKIIVKPPEESTFVPEENIIIGNVAFYGATSGEAYIRGMAGERFCVRNSGVHAVVESVGDHGCEYMTGGRAVILGSTGKNFAAGMSGGIAYVYDPHRKLSSCVNAEMVDLLELNQEEDLTEVKTMIEKHQNYTKSTLAENILKDWAKNSKDFIKVLPRDYGRVLNALEEVKQKGLSGDEAWMAAFEANAKSVARVGGN